LINNIIQILQL